MFSIEFLIGALIVASVALIQFGLWKQWLGRGGDPFLPIFVQLLVIGGLAFALGGSPFGRLVFIGLLLGWAAYLVYETLLKPLLYRKVRAGEISDPRTASSPYEGCEFVDPSLGRIFDRRV